MIFLTSEVIITHFRDAAAEHLRDTQRYVSLIHTSSFSLSFSFSVCLYLSRSISNNFINNCIRMLSMAQASIMVTARQRAPRKKQGLGPGAGKKLL